MKDCCFEAMRKMIKEVSVGESVILVSDIVKWMVTNGK